MIKIILDLYNNKIKHNEKIEVMGWVISNRNSGKLGFLVINDGSKFEHLQIVYKKDGINNFDQIATVRTGSVIKVKGIFTLTENSKQPFELQSELIEILDAAIEDYPLQKKEHSYEFLREIAHLRARTNTFNAVFRIRSACSFAIHQYFNQQNFIYVHSPIITGNDAEGAGEAFIVTAREDGQYEKDFFNKKASLTVSGQLNAEAFAQAFRKVYTFGPTFRAENSNTTKHAAEFWMIEPEIAFADLNEDMDIAEGLIKFVLNYLFTNNQSELKFLNDNIDSNLWTKLEDVKNSSFIRMSYTEAIEYLLKAKDEKIPFENNDIFWGMDLQTEHERYICEQITKKPTFLTNYPKEIKAFYMKLNPDNKTVATTDLLVPGIGELVGGSQREDDYDKLLKRCHELNVATSDLQWYLNLRQYGYYKSAGFGLGFERLIMYVTSIANIRDVIPFPRTPRNLLF